MKVAIGWSILLSVVLTIVVNLAIRAFRR